MRSIAVISATAGHAQTPDVLGGQGDFGVDGDLRRNLKMLREFDILGAEFTSQFFRVRSNGLGFFDPDAHSQLYLKLFVAPFAAKLPARTWSSMARDAAPIGSDADAAATNATTRGAEGVAPAPPFVGGRRAPTTREC